MKQLFLLWMCCLTVHIGTSQTHFEDNEGVATHFQNAERELNAAYKKIVKEYKSDGLFIKNLQTAQNSWLAFREAEMKAKFPQNSTYNTACYDHQLTRLTRQRTTALQIWLLDLQEGEACEGADKRYE